MVPFSTACHIGPLTPLLKKAAGQNAVTRVFRDQGIPIRILDKDDRFLPTQDLCGLFERAARAAGDRYFGMQLGSRIRITELGLPGRYVAEAPTVNGAMQRAAKAIRFATSGVEIQIRAHGRLVGFYTRSPVQQAIGSRHLSDVALGIKMDLLRRYAGPSWRPAWIELDYAKGPHAAEVEDRYQVPVRFDRPMTAVVFDRQFAAASRAVAPRIGSRLTFRDLRRMVSSGPPKTFSDSVREIVRLRLLDGDTGIDGVTERLRVGHRTLQRRLREEGNSYSDVLEEVRVERSSALLAETRESITNIAMGLGYASPAHFSRAFSRWTGRAPSLARSLQMAGTES